MAKEVLTTGLFTYNSVAYGVTDMNMSKVATEVDLTDTETAVNEKEFAAGRQERTFTITMWKDVTEADPPLATLYPVIIDFEGFSYNGNAIFTEVAQSATIDNGVVLNVSGRFSVLQSNAEDKRIWLLYTRNMLVFPKIKGNEICSL